MVQNRGFLYFSSPFFLHSADPDFTLAPRPYNIFKQKEKRGNDHCTIANKCSVFE